MEVEVIVKMMEDQRAYFNSGATLDVKFRIHALKKLRKTIESMEDEILAALHEDLGKGKSEGYFTEIGMVYSELDYMIRHTRSFAKDRVVHTPIAQFHSKSFRRPSPYGVVLVMSPWNYPFMLTMDPLIDALAAGNTVMVKPSAYAPATGDIIEKLIKRTFIPEYVNVVKGGRKENQALLDQDFDYIFFTGSVSVGKEVMRRASEHLVPITLELGGKSPVIVDATANLKLAARRLVFGKYLNVGQTCVAPDYVMVHESVHDEFVGYVKAEIERQYGDDVIHRDDYGKIINDKHYGRIMGLIDPDKVVAGGYGDPTTRKIAPTVLDHVTFDDAVMQEEIFGPIMPILVYSDLDEMINKIRDLPHPLALYLFTSSKSVMDKVTRSINFGGGCINDTIIHLATSAMPFGGVGESGMGSYHGKVGFDTFSHLKSIVNKSTWIDLPMRYRPYNKINDQLVRMFMK